MTGVTLDVAISKGKEVRERSDSEMARELQAELNGVPRLRSDSEVARELQKEWNSLETSADAVSQPQSKDISGMAMDSLDRSMLHRNDSLADGNL